MSHTKGYTEQSSKLVYPSSQVESTVPDYIATNYAAFIHFMEKSAEAQERLGFGQSLLQNLQTFRDFDTYQNGLVMSGILAARLDIVQTKSANDNIETDAFVDIVDSRDEIITTDETGTFFLLEDGSGFPEENGVVLINDEIIYYRKKEGNKFTDLERGVSGTTALPPFIESIKQDYYKAETVEDIHIAGAVVHNLSVLFLAAIAENIGESFTDDMNIDLIKESINKSSLLQNLKDFYQSKGSKLGIKALFKMLFLQNDVEVTYPGDRMIIPSDSGFVETQILRTVPIPEVLCDDNENWATPIETVGVELNLKSYPDHRTIYAKTFCNSVSVYPYNQEDQYEIYVDEDFVAGNLIANPNTTLTRAAVAIKLDNEEGVIQTSVSTVPADYTTLTVESTLGFPESGVIFVGTEGIKYTSKSLNQFFGCQRGWKSIMRNHPVGTQVQGPFYIEARYTKKDSYGEDVEYVSRSWPLGLVNKVKVKDPGLLHSETDSIFVNGPGRIDPRNEALASFDENYDDVLAESNVGEIGNITAGVNGVFFTDKYTFAACSNLPYYRVGPFSTNDTVGPDITGNNAIHVVPQEDQIQPNPYDSKGFDQIGIFVDGVPAYSNYRRLKIKQGVIDRVEINSKGREYVNPSLIIDEERVTPTEFDIGARGQIRSVTTTSTTSYTSGVTSRISSGEDAVIELKFNKYGRISTVNVTNRGKWYYDFPELIVVDSSGRGRGGLLEVITTIDGEIMDVEIIDGGIDYKVVKNAFNEPVMGSDGYYSSDTTYVEINPPGKGCGVNAKVESYTRDRVYSVNTNVSQRFDSGNGYLFNDGTGTMSQFGYMVDPIKLRERLGDDGTKHSPIIGWAYDGNPIYGPYCYTNKRNDFHGITSVRSGYVKRVNRVGLGSNPPSTTTYPMGTFVEDYQFDPFAVNNYPVISANNQVESSYTIKDENGNDVIVYPKPQEGDIIYTDPYSKDAFSGVIDPGDQIETFLDIYGSVALDENNGMVCNTPEYPVELYPDGRYCYFITNRGNAPAFPYIIGPNFQNKPISQNILLKDDDFTEDNLNNVAPMSLKSSYKPVVIESEDKMIKFNFKQISRYRNPYLESTKDHLQVKVDTITAGEISGIEVVQGLPKTTMVNDIVVFDNTGSMGAGAQGRVNWIQGENVTDARGSLIVTQLISHRQVIDLDYIQFKKVWNKTLKGWEYRLVNYPFEFVPDTEIQTTSGSRAIVESFDWYTKLLIVNVITARLIQPGDIFHDNAGEVCIVRDENLVTYMGPTNVRKTAPDPPGGLQAGMFYINIKDAYATSTWTGISGEFVSQDQAVYWDGTEWKINSYTTLWDNTGDSGYEEAEHGSEGLYKLDSLDSMLLTENSFYFLELEGNIKEVISKTPRMGSNLFVSYGEPTTAEQGDLWWSINNGRLYVYYINVYIDGEQITNKPTWVCAQPLGTRPLTGSSDVGIGFDPGEGEVPLEVIQQMVNGRSVTIANTAPSTRPLGKLNQLGDLWWSPATGLLYIWNTNSVFTLGRAGELIESEWVCTDPSGIVPMDGASDTSSIVPSASQLSAAEADDLNNVTSDSIYSPSITTILSADAPTMTPDGDPLTQGMLWWSPITGRMYIYYASTGVTTDAQWVVTNPIGMTSSEYSEDRLIVGDGGLSDASVFVIPELPTTTRLWFKDLRGFKEGEEILFEVAAPGLDGSIDTAVIKRKSARGMAKVIRREGSSYIPDGAPSINNTRASYTITCAQPVKLVKGDTIKIHGSDYDGLNTKWELNKVGQVITPDAMAVVGTGATEGQIIGVTFYEDQPGKPETRRLGSGFKQNFYCYFIGGSGQGGVGFCKVSPILKDGTGGNVIEPVQIINPGRGYIANDVDETIAGIYHLRIVWGTALTENMMQFWTSTLYEEEIGISYCLNKRSVMGYACECRVSSGGMAYESMPTIMGLEKRAGDAAEFEIEMSGTQIESVRITYAGRRYQNPHARFIDQGGNGYGATAAVTTNPNTGCITEVTMLTPGTGYTLPTMEVIDIGGKYIATTKNIGKIDSVSVLDPGRNISADLTLKPELLVECKAIVQMKQGSRFVRGEEVYQGVATRKYFTARVLWYDEIRDIVTLSFDNGEILELPAKPGTEYGGDLLPGEDLIGVSSESVAEVLVSGQADILPRVRGVSGTTGIFVTEESMLNRAYAVIQDSRYYQWFSYVISSPMQKSDYETYVKDMIHPVGFALFGNVIINESVESPTITLDAEAIEDTSVFLIQIDSEAYKKQLALLGTDGVDVPKDTMLEGEIGYKSS